MPTKSKWDRKIPGDSLKERQRDREKYTKEDLMKGVGKSGKGIPQRAAKNKRADEKTKALAKTRKRV